MMGVVCTADPVGVNCIRLATAGSPPKYLEAQCNGQD